MTAGYGRQPVRVCDGVRGLDERIEVNAAVLHLGAVRCPAKGPPDVERAFAAADVTQPTWLDPGRTTEIEV